MTWSTLIQLELGLVLGLVALGSAAWVVAKIVRRAAAADRVAAGASDAAEADHMRTRQAARLPGATPARAIEVASPAAVEARAEAIPCPACGQACHVEEHVVEYHDARRLRVAKVRCGGCGRRRPVYLVLREPE